MPATTIPRLADRLLAVAHAGAGDRILVLGPAGGAEMLAAALHRGCRGAAAFTILPKRPEPAEVVVAARVDSEEAGFAIADCARRALSVGGRLAVRLFGAGAASAQGLAARLRAYGFDRVRLRARAEGDLLLVCHRAALDAPQRAAGRSR